MAADAIILMVQRIQLWEQPPDDLAKFDIHPTSEVET
jgi:hypothetical protein